MSKIKLSKDFIRNSAKIALNEDLYPSGDITSNLVNNNKITKFKLLSTSNSTIIVESLNDGKRVPVHTANKVSSLDDISIYTYEEDKPLAEVFELIKAKESGGPAIDPKSDGKALRSYMEELLPDYDSDRVYSSDLKKLFTWYNTLQKLGLLNEDTNEEEDSAQEEPASTGEKTESTETTSAE